MRSKTASRGTCIVRLPSWASSQRREADRDGRPRPYGDQAESDRGSDVEANVKPLAILHQIECLQAERGERRIPAEHADHDELPGRGADQQAAVRTGQCSEKADDERPYDIDDEG